MPRRIQFSDRGYPRMRRARRFAGNDEIALAGGGEWRMKDLIGEKTRCAEP